jgi:hypothetical protein
MGQLKEFEFEFFSCDSWSGYGFGSTYTQNVVRWITG